MDKTRLLRLAGIQINESISDDYEELIAQLNRMKVYGESFKTMKEEFANNNGQKFIDHAKNIIKITKQLQKQLK